MELKSDPKQYDTIQVTDIDIAFPGDTQMFTLLGQDSYKVVGDVLTLTFASGGVITVYLHYAHFWAVRPRAMRVPATGTDRA